MSYTPAFQNILDEIDRMSELGCPVTQIQQFFQEQCRKLGAYERLNNLYRIRPKRPVPGEPSRLQFFKMNRMQDAFYKAHTTRDLVLKMRQGGVTTLSCLIALDLALWEDGVNTAIMAHVRDNVKKFFRIIKTAFTSFKKDWGKLYPISESTDNVNELKIKETDSTLSVITEGKGLTLDFLHISEAAFVEDTRISESLESVPFTGWVIMETTPDTASGLFYDLWDLQQRGESCAFKGHFFAWWFQYPEDEDLPRLKALPDFAYTDKELILLKSNSLTKEHILWRRLKLSESGGDEGEFARKYPEDPLTCFLSGSRSVFASDILAALWMNEKPPAFMGDLMIKSHGPSA